MPKITTFEYADSLDSVSFIVYLLLKLFQSKTDNGLNENNVLQGYVGSGGDTFIIEYDL